MDTCLEQPKALTFRETAWGTFGTTSNLCRRVSANGALRGPTAAGNVPIWALLKCVPHCKLRIA